VVRKLLFIVYGLVHLILGYQVGIQCQTSYSRCQLSASLWTHDWHALSCSIGLKLIVLSQVWWYCHRSDGTVTGHKSDGIVTGVMVLSQVWFYCHRSDGTVMGVIVRSQEERTKLYDYLFE